MNKKILLVEPAYKTKYPPLGLMKISTYHRKIKNDDVTFVKGCNLKVYDEYWDRIYISTLFTYTWKETVKTIRFYKETLFNISNKIFVGGIIATLMPHELFNETGIQPVEGILDDPKKIDQDDDVIIDSLPPDYEILKQVEDSNFKYAYTDSYLGYATRGCVRRCEFCAVSTLEPKYIPYVRPNIKERIKDVITDSGEKQNLLLIDNNLLASPRFDDIIDDIKAAGFIKGASFGNTKRKRIVDFNQGLDARLLTEEKMKRLAEIPLEPMRIAFDHIKYKETYVKAVRLAHKFGQKDMSNYILYNYNDSPDDFYERLEINIKLNEEFRNNSAVHTTIYSFPMRYIPLNAKNRDVNTGNKFWTKRYLRGLQVILNVIKGPVMPGADFFYQAFGENSEELKAILLMPDDYIRNRVVADWHNIKDRKKRLTPYIKKWLNIHGELSQEENGYLNEVLSKNIQDIRDAVKNSNKRIKYLLECHLNAENTIAEYKNVK